MSRTALFALIGSSSVLLLAACADVRQPSESDPAAPSGTATAPAASETRPHPPFSSRAPLSASERDAIQARVAQRRPPRAATLAQDIDRNVVVEQPDGSLTTQIALHNGATTTVAMLGRSQ